MTRLQKLLLIEFWFFCWLPFLGAILTFALGPPGFFLWLMLVAVWTWQWFAFNHYRFCRQEEFLFVLQTAADTKAPFETVLGAYLKDRPKDEAYHFWVGCLLTFVFPGYYWIHKLRSFDVRLGRVAALLHGGVPLGEALRRVPGVASREIALAVAVGHFSGNLPQALHRLPDRQLALHWLEMAPRLAYPLVVLTFLFSNVSFMVIFIIPKFEKIFLEFKMKLPFMSELMIASSRWFGKHGWIVPIFWLFLLVAFDLLLLSSRCRWHFPLVGWLYRMHARGQFLNVLGLMLQTKRPLPDILGQVAESGLLPTAIADRARALRDDVELGEPLAQSLVRHGLATESMCGLILTAEKAQNLPWALEELGNSLTRRCVQISHRIAVVSFPLAIFACAMLVAFVAVAMFEPLIAVLEGLSK